MKKELSKMGKAEAKLITYISEYVHNNVPQDEACGFFAKLSIDLLRVMTAFYLKFEEEELIAIYSLTEIQNSMNKYFDEITATIRKKMTAKEE